jgi:predicted PurR-regulated permease PerM
MTPANPRLEWQRAITTLSAVVVVVVVVAVLYLARSICIPLALAIFLAFVLSPVVDWLERRRLGRLLAVLATVGLVATAAALTGALVTWQMAALTSSLPDHEGNIKAKITTAKRWFSSQGESRFGQFIQEIGSVITQSSEEAQVEANRSAGRSALGAAAGGPAALPKSVTMPSPLGPPHPAAASPPSWLNEGLGTFLSPAAEIIGQAAFAFILSVFMLLKQEDLRNRLIRLTGDVQVTTTTRAVHDASQRISNYLFMQLLINTGYGVAITLALLLLGVKYALLWGFLASLMRYVPYLGTWIGMLPPVIFTLATAEGWWLPLAVAAIYGGFELTCNNVFEPWLYGTSMGLSEVAQLVAAAFWAFLWGPIGLILSGPLTVCLLILGKYVPRFSFLEVLLGDEPALNADVRIYQRLAARDQDEAAEVAHEELKASSAEQAFDTVLIPALTYARRDHARHSLSDDDLRAITTSMREIIDEVLESRLHPAAPVNEPAAPPVRLLAVPARDEADELVLEMLRGLLDPARWEVEVATDERLTSEVVTHAAEAAPAVIVIGSLPPGGLAHTRYLCKRLDRECPDARLVVGRWGLSEDMEQNREQLGEAGADHVATSLADAVQYLSGWAAALATQQEAADKSAPPPPVGTVSA